MGKIKVALISEIFTPYRSPLLKKISEQEEILLKVFYCAEREYGRDWNLNLKNEGYDFEVLKGKQITFKGKTSFSFKINLSIWKKLKEGSFDVVVIGGYAHLTMLLAIIFCLFTKTPYIFMSESHLLNKRTFLKKFIKRIYLKPIIKRTSANLPTGTLAKEYLISYGANPNSIFFFPNTVDVSYFEKESNKWKNSKEIIKKEYGIFTNYTITFVGRLVPVKGIETLIEAFYKLSQKRNDLSLLIVGDGYLKEKLEKYVLDKNIKNIFFLGFIEQDILPKIYAISDIFVLPSLNEPWGAVVCEAMSAKLPLILSDKVGAGKDMLIEGKNGYYFKAGDSNSLYDSLEKILSAPQNLNALGLESSKIIKKWDYDFAVNNFLKAVKSAVKAEKE